MKKIKMKKLTAIALSTVMMAGTFAIIAGATEKSDFALAEETTEVSAEVTATVVDDTATVKQQNISDFLRDGQSIIYQTELYDFDGNEFMLYELAPAGYAIYSLKGEASVLVEGALSSNSPFYEYLDRDIVYLGFCEYYYRQGNDYINIMTEESYKQSALPQGYYLKDEAYYESEDTEDEEETSQISTLSTSLPKGYRDDNYVEEDDFIKIADHEYFETLSKFPKNENGTCSIVALCIVLGYMDEYINDGFIPDNATYEGKSFKDGTGTSQSLHDYMFDNCLHTLAGISSDDGYPMANGEINNTLKDYLINICGEDFEDEVTYVDGCLFNTHKNPRKYIKAGYPALITMTSYKTTNYDDDYDGVKMKYHTVVAYGYNEDDDTFLVHMGWKSGTTNGAQVIVSDATIYSYNTFVYTG